MRGPLGKKSGKGEAQVIPNLTKGRSREQGGCERGKNFCESLQGNGLECVEGEKFPSTTSDEKKNSSIVVKGKRENGIIERALGGRGYEGAGVGELLLF